MSLGNSVAALALRPVDINDLPERTRILAHEDPPPEHPSVVGSTALYITSLASRVASIDRLASPAQAGLFSDAYTKADINTFETDVLKQLWMMTIALGINVHPVSRSSPPTARCPPRTEQGL
ncbi:hypothetical protein GSI_11127 [Ganoderma sinense ZZ0214-1]|uniref:Uncharacterized protein n=1 Tax=Ganoderma sinense ZZ0214-1 TaxID=1077348 RepID=A0A2G8RZ45_9APHY|nr:hypothetical protein GSI_11127 [Ganoderma sinense ZZ0214-1]